MIKSDQAKEIATYLRELSAGLAEDEISINATSVGITTLADAIEANENVMCGIDIMRRVRTGTG
jgi:hypothetical protein